MLALLRRCSTEVEAADLGCIGGIDGPGGAVGDAGFVPGARSQRRRGWRRWGSRRDPLTMLEAKTSSMTPPQPRPGFLKRMPRSVPEKDAVGDDDIADAAGGFAAEGDSGVGRGAWCSW